MGAAKDLLAPTRKMMVWMLPNRRMLPAPYPPDGDVSCMVEQGRVAVNYRLLRDFNTRVMPSDIVTVDDEPIPKEEPTMVCLHLPSSSPPVLRLPSLRSALSFRPYSQMSS